MPDLPERDMSDLEWPMSRGTSFEMVMVEGRPYFPESRLREVEAELVAMKLQVQFAHELAEDKVEAMREQLADLRADLAALVEALERLVLAGRYINIAPPREDDANRQSDHDEFYAANQAGEVAARAVLDRLKEDA